MAKGPARGTATEATQILVPVVARDDDRERPIHRDVEQRVTVSSVVRTRVAYATVSGSRTRVPLDPFAAVDQALEEQRQFGCSADAARPAWQRHALRDRSSRGYPAAESRRADRLRRFGELDFGHPVIEFRGQAKVEPLQSHGLQDALV